MSFPLLSLFGYATAGLAFAALAVLLAVRRSGDRIGTLLLIAVLTQVAWAAVMSGFMYGGPLVTVLAPLAEASRTLLWVLFLIQLATSAVAVSGNATFAASHARPFTGPCAAGAPVTADDEPVGRAGRRALVIAVVLATASAGTELMAASWGLVFATRTIAAVFGLVCLEQVYRNASEGRRWGIKFLGLALAALFGFDLLMYSEAMLFSRLNEALWVARGFANSFLAPLVAISAARNPHWKIDVGVSRQAVFHTAALSVTGGALVLISAGGYYVRWFGGEWGEIAQALLLFAALLGIAVVLMSGTARARLRVFVSKHFFSYRFDYRGEWMRLTELLAGGETPDLPSRAIVGLGRPVESQSGAMWLEAGGMYHFEGGVRWRDPQSPIPGDAPLLGLLRDHEWIVNLAELRSGAVDGSNAKQVMQQGLQLPEAIAAHAQGWLIVPLLLEGELLGFVVLDRPLAPQPFDWETRDLLKAAAYQIASQIGMRRALEKLIRAQQFESFNRMSAFVVHDLKNLVAQLGLMTRNAQRHRGNPEFQDDMLATVENVMERMQGLLLQLRPGNKPVEKPAPVKLAEVLLAAVAARRGLRPEPLISIDEGCTASAAAGSRTASAPATANGCAIGNAAREAATLAHRDRLERVIGHLVQNAAEACGPEGHVELRLRCEGEQALIEVEDNGQGMSDAFVRERLFQPFESTKAHGMGIGAFESREYLREIGGALEVSSSEGVGTLLRIRLPLAMGTMGTMRNPNG